MPKKGKKKRGDDNWEDEDEGGSLSLEPEPEITADNTAGTGLNKKAKSKKKGKGKWDDDDDDDDLGDFVDLNEEAEIIQKPTTEKKAKGKKKGGLDVGKQNAFMALDMDDENIDTDDLPEIIEAPEVEEISMPEPSGKKGGKKSKKKKEEFDFEIVDLEDLEEELSEDKPKKEKKAKQADEDNQNEDGEVHIKTAAEKKAEKKEKERKKKELEKEKKAKKKQQKLEEDENFESLLAGEGVTEDSQDKKKKKKKKKKKDEDEDEEMEDEEIKIEKTEIMEDAQAEVETEDSKKKKKKKKGAEAEVDKAEGEEQTSKAVEDAGEGAAQEGAGEEEDDEEEEGGEDSKKKKKKKKKKKAAAAEEEDKPKVKKPARGAIKQMQEALEQLRLEEEKKKREEEERIKAEEEAEERRLEKIRLEQERKEKKKQKDKERKQRLKAEGKLLSKSERESRARAEAMLEAMRAQGIAVPSKTDDNAVRKPVRYGSKKPRKQQQQQQQQQNDTQEPKEDTETKTETPEPVEPPKDDLENEKEAKEGEQEEEAVDSWEAKADDEEDVKDNWDDEDEEKEEKKTETPKVKVDIKDAATKNTEKKETPAKKEEHESEEESEEEDEEEEEEEESGSEESSSEEESESESDSDSDGDQRSSAERQKEKARLRIERRRISAKNNRDPDRLRSPVICVLGHVDTGKTKILDKIRRTHVQDGEAGGITQQIGATMVPVEAIRDQTKMVREFQSFDIKIPGLLIIDTPGHESFSNLRSRGSSLCDMAILVVDLMHGLEPQTIESLNMLKKRRTPFIVALNKIDRLFEWKQSPTTSVVGGIKKQKQNTKFEFEDRVQVVIREFAEQGLNAAPFYDNPDDRNFISLVPTSAITGDGMGDLISLLVKLTQTRLQTNLEFTPEVDCTVLEVKAITGLGTTIDVILVNGHLNEGDTIVVAGNEGPIVTQIRALLTPQPMRELRVKNSYIKHKKLYGAQGVKICAKELDKALAGTPLFVAQRQDEVEVLRDEVEQALKETLSLIKLSDRGVYVQASTLGSLEALLEFLKTSKIPYSNISIGPVHKRDIMKASVMLEHDSQYAVILAFDVRIERDAQEMADSLGVKIFSADIIYHLFDQFTAWREDLKQKKRDEFRSIATFPCKLKVLPQHIFNSRDPIVIGVLIEDGIVQLGTPITVPSKNFVDIGIVTGIEANHKSLDSARKGLEVCVKIEPIPGETPKLYGRHFDSTDALVSKISRESIDACKEYFRDDLQKSDWVLMIELKKTFGII